MSTTENERSIQRIKIDQSKYELEAKKKLQYWLTSFTADKPLVIVPIFDDYDELLECLDNLLANTSSDTPLLLFDDASPDNRIMLLLEALSSERGFLYLRRQNSSGLVHNLNRAVEWSAPRDVIVVSSAVVVSPGWVERLQTAAYSRSTVATATAFSNNGTFLSIPHRNTPIPNLVKGLTAEQTDRRISETSLKLHPLIPVAQNYCAYYRRSALDVVGSFDEAFASGVGADTDFSLRATAAGFSHALTDNLFVFHKLTSPAKAEDSAAENRLRQRYPWYTDSLKEAKNATGTPLALALERARSALLGYRIAIDATALDGLTTGAQVLVLELIRALAALVTPKHLAVIIRDDVPKKVLLDTEALVDEVLRVGELENLEQPRFDLVHRPYQIYSPEALSLLQRCARRVIVSHLDFINFSNPTYFANTEDWRYFQELTRHVFAAADGIAFISQDAAQEATQHGLTLPEQRSCVTYVGVDHHLSAVQSRPPAESSRFQGQPFIVIVGHNLKHKNRIYALQLFKRLSEQYQWPGHVVLIGPNVVAGGSGSEEALFRLSNPQLRDQMHYLGAVAEAEKQWLLANSALVLYPSIAEGFGLVPFEAAAVGKPALTTRSTSLGEVLGEEVAYLELLDPEQDAATAWALISNPEAAARQVAAIQARATFFTWEGVAAKTWEFYERVLGLLPRQRYTASSTSAGIPQHGGNQRNGNLSQEYQRLEKWATELNQRLTTLEKKPIYRILSRFKLL